MRNHPGFACFSRPGGPNPQMTGGTWGRARFCGSLWETNRASWFGFWVWAFPRLVQRAFRTPVVQISSPWSFCFLGTCGGHAGCGLASRVSCCVSLLRTSFWCVCVCDLLETKRKPPVSVIPKTTLFLALQLPLLLPSCFEGMSKGNQDRFSGIFRCETNLYGRRLFLCSIPWVSFSSKRGAPLPEKNKRTNTRVFLDTTGSPKTRANSDDEGPFVGGGGGGTFPPKIRWTPRAILPRFRTRGKGG